MADTVDLPALARANSGESRSPIFVTGLPRSGTTLTEQILAAHSSTTGVGEASWWPRTTFEFYRTLSLKKLDKATIERSIRSMADAYFDKAMSDFPTAGRIVDKSLMKHEQIGIVLAAMPKSKMIVLKRDPRDNLLSIFKNQFRAGQVSYNNDLDGLAWTYRKYLDAIAFWQEQFPDQFYVLDYDKLTSDPESEARKLLKFADLDWEDSVLEFHKSTSTVKTLSVYQVRQPIYTSSQKGWQKFGSKIEPLIEALRRHNVPLDEG